MGDWSGIPYIISQVLTIVASILICSSFFIKRRVFVLIVTISANVILIVAWGFLGAFIGLGMIGVEIVRDIASYSIYQKRDKKYKYRILRLDWIMLFLYLTAMVLITVFTETGGVMSLFAFFAVFFFTVGIWQKKRLVFLICAIISEACWIVYNIYIESIFGLVWEVALFIGAIAGLILYIRRREKVSQKHCEQLGRATICQCCKKPTETESVDMDDDSKLASTAKS